MKILKIFGITLAVLIAVLLLGRNVLVKWGAQVAVSSMTDLTLRIDKLNIGLFSTKLDIQGLKIYNPKGYQDPLMLDLPRFYVDYNLMDILGGKLHLKDVKFHLNEFMLVKQKDGTSNIDSLKALAAKKEEAAPEKAPEQKTPPEKKQLPIQIDSLALKIGQVVIKDYSKGGQPEVNTYQVNIDQTFKDITDINTFVTTLLLKHMSKFVTSAISSVGLDKVGGVVGDSVGAIGKFGTEALKKGLNLGTGAVGEAGSLLKNTGEGVKKIITLPFGTKGE